VSANLKVVAACSVQDHTFENKWNMLALELMLTWRGSNNKMAEKRIDLVGKVRYRELVCFAL